VREIHVVPGRGTFSRAAKLLNNGDKLVMAPGVYAEAEPTKLPGVGIDGKIVRSLSIEGAGSGLTRLVYGGYVGGIDMTLVPRFHVHVEGLTMSACAAGLGAALTVWGEHENFVPSTVYEFEDIEFTRERGDYYWNTGLRLIRASNALISNVFGRMKTKEASGGWIQLDYDCTRFVSLEHVVVARIENCTAAFFDVGIEQVRADDPVKFNANLWGVSGTREQISPGAKRFVMKSNTLPSLPEGSVVRIYAAKDANKWMRATLTKAYEWRKDWTIDVMVQTGDTCLDDMGVFDAWVVAVPWEGNGGCEGLSVSDCEFMSNNYDLLLGPYTFNTHVTNTTFAMARCKSIYELKTDDGDKEMSAHQFVNNWFDACHEGYMIHLVGDEIGFVNNSVSVSPAFGHKPYRGGVNVEGKKNRIIGNTFSHYGSGGGDCTLYTAVQLFGPRRLGNSVSHNTFNNPYRAGESGYMDICLFHGASDNIVSLNVGTNTTDAGRFAIFPGCTTNWLLHNKGNTVNYGGLTNLIE
jgi:hypothetical protein